MSNIKIELAKTLKEKPQNENELGFGSIFTDHMFIMNYDVGEGWHDARIVPYGPLSLDPAAMILHYGQEVFEGLKAYRTRDNRILLFRPQENFKRLNNSNQRLCIPKMDEEFLLHALTTLLNVEKDWVPHQEGTSLYIRPFIIATDPKLGVHPAEHYLFIIILSPVGAYYQEGLNPVKIYVKTSGNYASSLKAQEEAEEQQYTQVLWLDGVEKKYIEEVGTMNVFFKIDGEVITPELNGSILPGVTRKSAIELVRSWGYPVSERKLSIEEVARAHDEGKLEEAFGTGTAAVISPIGLLKWGDKLMEIGGGKIGELSQRIYDELTAIQWGHGEDKFGWTYEVK